MNPSSFRMPGWWQSLWRRRYPCGVQGYIGLVMDSGRWYAIRPMPCGCGYRVFYMDSTRIGPHCPTLRGAVRQARRHARV